MKAERIVVFDGECLLCSGFVRFIIKRDRRVHFHLVAAQTELGQQIQNSAGVDVLGQGSVLLVEGDGVFVKSRAVLRIVGQLGGAWKLTRILKWVPVPLGDWVYMYISHRRIRWFGRSEQCMLPTAETEAHFLK